MPPRYAYWTILAGGLPTAFRAAEKEELLPTFSRIREKHPDAEMKWFARGRLWDSPESARRDLDLRRRADSGRNKHGTVRRTSSGQESRTIARGRDWRPGGENRDPRQQYQDGKTARNIEHRRRKFVRRQQSAGSTRHDPRGERGGPQAKRPFNPHGRSGSLKRRAPPRSRPEEPEPSRPPGPTREPRRREGTEPTPPPRPTEPVITPPGPPERGRLNEKDGKKRE